MGIEGYIKFDHPNVGYVFDGLEDITFRLNLEREFEEGQRVALRTPGDVGFCVAEIEYVREARVRKLWLDSLADGRSHPAENLEDLVRMLRDHYPFRPISRKTEGTAVAFRPVFPRFGGK
jgi:hypothetical protein